jgi:RND family efflux transporter MFP subunit
MTSDHDAQLPDGQAPEEPRAPPGAAKPPRRIRIGRFLLILLAIAIVVAADGIISRRHSDAELEHWTRERAIPTVAVITPKGGVGTSPLILPGDIEAWYNAPIHAQVSGYVRSWKKDIGARVKTGDVLAEIDTPELDERIAQAGEELTKAKANRAFAETTAKRWQALRNSDAVSQQATDEKESDKIARDADVAAAEDNLERLRALKGFANIVAPFDGVVTARNTDIGQLIAAGAPGATPLFMVADERHLRVYVQVPQAYTAQIAAGATTAVTVPEYPDRSFSAQVVTNATAVDPANGSQLTELLIDNTDGSLKPGGYALVRFALPTQAGVVRIPSSALLTRDTGVSVALLRPNGHVHIQPIRIARDLGAAVEVAGGVSADDPVIDNPADTLQEGDLVRRTTAAAPGTAGRG